VDSVGILSSTSRASKTRFTNGISVADNFVPNSDFEPLTSWGLLQKEPGTIPNGKGISQCVTRTASAMRHGCFARPAHQVAYVTIDVNCVGDDDDDKNSFDFVLLEGESAEISGRPSYQKESFAKETEI